MEWVCVQGEKWIRRSGGVSENVRVIILNRSRSLKGGRSFSHETVTPPCLFGPKPVSHWWLWWHQWLHCARWPFAPVASCLCGSRDPVDPGTATISFSGILASPCRLTTCALPASCCQWTPITFTGERWQSIVALHRFPKSIAPSHHSHRIN